MVHAAQQGEEPASPEVAKVAKDMKKSDAKDFASTKHKGLPNHVKQEILNRLKEYALTIPGHNIKPAAPAQSLDDLEGVNESWSVKDGNVLSNGKLIGYYDFDRDSDSFWVDDVKKGKGQLSFDTKKEVEDYFKKNEKDAVKHLQKLREGKELKWQDVEVGDAANVKAINKTGLIIKTYGRKFHLKFPNGSTKTYDANELTFVKNESINESMNPREDALIKTFKNIVDTHSSLKVKDGGRTTLVDVQSANAVLKVYDNLSDTNKKSFFKMPLDKMIKTAWHILGKL